MGSPGLAQSHGFDMRPHLCVEYASIRDFAKLLLCCSVKAVLQPKFLAQNGRNDVLQIMKSVDLDARRKLRRKIMLRLTFVLISMSGPVVAADFEVGLKAFRAGEIQQALDEWQPLAETGHADAQHALGMMYEYGHGVERDDVRAASWYEKAAAQDNSEAQYRLGVFHDNGWGVTRDADLAVKWYARAAVRGHVFAQHDLAFMYVNGTGVPHDKIQAYKWLRIASAQRADLMTKHLYNVSKSMTPEEIHEAERLALAWLNAQEL